MILPKQCWDLLWTRYCPCLFRSVYYFQRGFTAGCSVYGFSAWSCGEELSRHRSCIAHAPRRKRSQWQPWHRQNDDVLKIWRTGGYCGYPGNWMRVRDRTDLPHVGLSLATSALVGRAHPSKVWKPCRYIVCTASLNAKLRATLWYIFANGYFKYLFTSSAVGFVLRLQYTRNSIRGYRSCWKGAKEVILKQLLRSIAGTWNKRLNQKEVFTILLSPFFHLSIVKQVEFYIQGK